MNELRLVVVGAAGRMGRMLTQIIPDTLGVRLTAALERPGSAALGADSGGARAERRADHERRRRRPRRR